MTRRIGGFSIRVLAAMDENERDDLLRERS